MKLPPPILRQHEGFHVLRDDLLPGGTKRRVLQKVLASIKQPEVVYAACQYGQGHIALAHACQDLGKSATLYYPDYKVLSDGFRQAERVDAKCCRTHENASQREVGEIARRYAQDHDAVYMPIGFAFEEFRSALSELALVGDAEYFGTS